MNNIVKNLLISVLFFIPGIVVTAIVNRFIDNLSIISQALVLLLYFILVHYLWLVGKYIYKKSPLIIFLFILEFLTFLLVGNALRKNIFAETGWRLIPINSIEAKIDSTSTSPSYTPIQVITSTTSCDNDRNMFCTDFSDIASQFSNIEDFTQDRVNSRILRTNLPADGDQDNSILTIKNQLFGPEFNFTLVTKLLNKEKGNLTITYGKDWRCIIGEADHKKVICQSEYNKKNSPREAIYLSTLGKPDIPEDTELTIDGSVTIGTGNSYNIKLILKYFDVNSNPVEAELNFKAKYKSNNLKEIKKDFGVGIIDNEDEGIKVEFIKLEVRGGQ